MFCRRALCFVDMSCIFVDVSCVLKTWAAFCRHELCFVDVFVHYRRLSCSWLIEADNEYEEVVIQIDVLNSSMEYSTGCVRDSVNIYDGKY